MFLQEEIERLALSGVLRLVEYSRWVSRASLVPTPAGPGWRLIVDLTKINKACQTCKMKMEKLRSIRLIAKPGDHSVSFDLKDRFYSLAIDPQDKKNVHCRLRRQAVAIFCVVDGLEPHLIHFP